MMSQGGGQQSQGYNMSGLNSSGNGYATSQPMQQSFQPAFMSQPNYGYQNPYAQMFSTLSQQQQMQPQAPVQIQPNTPPVAQAQPTQPAAFDQTANNVAAGLPAQGQPVPQANIVANTSAPSSGTSAPANTLQDYNTWYAANSHNYRPSTDPTVLRQDYANYLSIK